jgi:hypothetical protein
MANKQSIQEPNHADPEAEAPTQTSEESKPDEDDFKITVKKLDTVVKPRGVLADG